MSITDRPQSSKVTEKLHLKKNYIKCKIRTDLWKIKIFFGELLQQ